MAPLDHNQSASLEQALTRFVDERLQGKQPDIAEFVAQYPQCEAELWDRLQDLEEIDALFDSLTQADESDFAGTAAEPDLVGRKIGKFEITKIIGRGGMGVVYLARDTRLDRSVAVKSMPPALAHDATARMRLHREARLLASVHHTNIAVIHDIIEQKESSGYLILEYVPGPTLAQRIARGPLKLHVALSIGQQIAEAVAAAHEKGVIHRDLKPGNIKITPEGKIKVLDFGLAKAARSGDQEVDNTVTQPGQVLGTPAYMSPEQARGQATDQRSDIWSFGCILYQMLTGQLPFEGATATDTLARIIEHQPDWEKLPPETPSNIRVLIRRCLEKDPRRRLQDIGDAIIEISETLNLPATAPPVTTPSSASLQPRVDAKHRLRTAATIVAIAATLIALSVVAVQRASRQHVQSPAGQIRLAVLPFENLGAARDEYFAGGITDAVRARLAAVQGLGVVSRQSAMQYQKHEKNTQRIAQELRVDYILEGTIQRERPSDPNSRVRIIPRLIKAAEDIQVWTDVYDDDMSEVFRLQSELAEQVAEALNVALLEPEQRTAKPTENIEAYDFYLQGEAYQLQSHLRADFKETGLQMAARMFERAVELDPDFVLGYASLCATHCNTYRFNYDRSPARLARAKQALDQALRLDPDLPETHLALGHYHLVQSDRDRALEQFEMARQSQPNNTETIAMTGYLLRVQGDLERALARFNEALELNPLNVPLSAHTGNTYMYLRRYAEAERYFNHAIALAPQEPLAYRYKAVLYLLSAGSTRKARAVLAEAQRNVASIEGPFVDILATLDTCERNYQGALDRLASKAQDIDDFDDLVSSCLAGGQNYACLDKKELAEQRYDQARSMLVSKIAEWPEDARFHGWLGIAYAGLGRKADAIAEGNLAVKLSSENAMACPDYMAQLAQIYAMVGELDAAVDQLEALLSRPAWMSVPLLRLDPTWDPLRRHPRFQKLLQAHQ